ncbi:MAG: rhodanese-like domain-containing protein [Deltaproteobacteria bacterium]|nr:rhodanese-like domain-containing protein [Deltaproteobacteria bacterium]
MKRALLLLAIAACSKSSSTATDKPAEAPHATGVTVKKDPAQAKQLIAQGATVVDVRTPDEFSGGHLPQATNVPIQSFDVTAVDKLVGGDKSKPVVVYCARGGRAQKAKDQLEAAGYTDVVNGGGYDDLRSD